MNNAPLALDMPIEPLAVRAHMDYVAHGVASGRLTLLFRTFGQDGDTWRVFDPDAHGDINALVDGEIEGWRQAIALMRDGQPARPEHYHLVVVNNRGAGLSRYVAK